MLLTVWLMLAGGSALAQQLPAAPLGSPGQQMRSLSLTNQSGQVITSAEAQMTDGRKRVLTYAPIERNQARAIVVPRQECLDSVEVHLNNGQTLRASHLHDCKATKIVVGTAGIRLNANLNPLRH
ncbi:MAG TPA: hypothetical protein VMB34_18750 [Acetobacteraceae bacterium]|nr:hypothetical protein [Acetobacteraceae bacterium]